jgi:hypothetical protein
MCFSLRELFLKLIIMLHGTLTGESVAFNGTFPWHTIDKYTPWFKTSDRTQEKKRGKRNNCSLNKK